MCKSMHLKEHLHRIEILMSSQGERYSWIPRRGTGKHLHQTHGTRGGSFKIVKYHQSERISTTRRVDESHVSISGQPLEMWRRGLAKRHGYVLKSTGRNL